MSDLIDRQAAIDAIEKLCEECNADYCGECRVKFDGLKNCKTILEQLPPVKPEYCEDAISRELALEKMADYVASGYADSAEDFEEYSKIICQLPSVKPEQKTGHWIELDNCSNSGYYCSECHKRVVKEGWSDTVKIIKYCPNCGAKMGGEQNE